MILIGRNVSPFVRRVAALMSLLEIDFEQRFWQLRILLTTLLNLTH